MSVRINMWESQHLDLGTCQCVNLRMSQRWISWHVSVRMSQHFNMWTSQRLDMWMATCERFNSLNVPMSQHLTMQMSQQISVWCWHVNLCMSQHANVLPSQRVIVNITTRECHSTSAPKSWVSHCLPSKPSPSEPWWILAHGNLNPYGSSLLVQTSTRFYRWKDTWSSFVTVR